MARRSKSSPLEDLFELVALLPWWAGTAAGCVLYLLLHGYAKSGTNIVLVPLAGIFQYILPFICFGAAATSAWKKSQRKSLAANVTLSESASSLDGMSWKQFEILVGEAFRQKGYQVTELGGSGPDGGVDLVLAKGGEKFLVQCKQWKAFKVGVDVVRQLYGVMAAKGVAGGFVVTSGKFTGDAKEFAKGRNVTLIDGERLFVMLQSAKAGIREPVQSATPTAATASATPACPACGSMMVKREAKRGNNAGNAFWGCSTYPKCRGTATII